MYRWFTILIWVTFWDVSHIFLPHSLIARSQYKIFCSPIHVISIYGRIQSSSCHHLIYYRGSIVIVWYSLISSGCNCRTTYLIYSASYIFVKQFIFDTAIPLCIWTIVI
jgi:hypothetical protein